MAPKEVIPAGYGHIVALNLGGRRKASFLLHDRVIELPDDRSPELTHSRIRGITIYSTEKGEPITVCEARSYRSKDVVFFPSVLKERFDEMRKPWE